MPMFKNLLVVIFVFVPICPSYAEDLTSLIAPKSKDTGVCGNSSDPANSSTMCRPTGEGKKNLLMNPVDAGIEEIYIPAIAPLLKEVVLEPDEELPPKKISRKKRSALKAKARAKQKSKKKIFREPAPDPESETELEASPSVTKIESQFVKDVPALLAPARTFEYTVLESDALNTIIRQHLNEKIQPGQKIIVVAQSVASSSACAPVLEPKTIEYTVQQGDTLSSILRKYFNGNIYGKRSRLERLLELNKNIKEADTIYLGQKIIIPDPAQGVQYSVDQNATNPDKATSAEIVEREKKLSVYFNYRFNYISVTDSLDGLKYNFNTDYDLEGGIEYLFRISPKNAAYANVGFSEYSMPRSVASPSIIVDPMRKTQGSASLGIRYDMTEENVFFLSLKYRPYFFLTNLKLEYLPAPAVSLKYENHFYHENQTKLGFGLAGEAIAKQDYPQFKSESGSAFLVNFLYQQEFMAKDRVTIEFIFQQRNQGSTYYRMNDKNAGFMFTYTLSL